MFEDAYQLDGPNQLDYFVKKNFTNKEEAGDYIVAALDKSKLNSKETLYNTVLKDIQSLKNYNDDLLTILKELDAEREVFNAEQKRREGVLKTLFQMRTPRYALLSAISKDTVLPTPRI